MKETAKRLTKEINDKYEFYFTVEIVYGEFQEDAHSEFKEGFWMKTSNEKGHVELQYINNNPYPIEDVEYHAFGMMKNEITVASAGAVVYLEVYDKNGIPHGFEFCPEEAYRIAILLIDEAEKTKAIWDEYAEGKNVEEYKRRTF